MSYNEATAVRGAVIIFSTVGSALNVLQPGGLIRGEGDDPRYRGDEDERPLSQGLTSFISRRQAL